MNNYDLFQKMIGLKFKRFYTPNDYFDDFIKESDYITDSRIIVTERFIVQFISSFYIMIKYSDINFTISRSFRPDKVNNNKICEIFDGEEHIYTDEEIFLMFFDLIIANKTDQLLSKLEYLKLLS